MAFLVPRALMCQPCLQAQKIGAGKEFCTSLILKAMAAARKGSCSSADVCLARELIKNKHCKAPASVVNNANWKCSCPASAAANLPKISTPRLQKYIPDSVHASLGITKPPMQAVAPTTALFGDSICGSIAPLVRIPGSCGRIDPPTAAAATAAAAAAGPPKPPLCLLRELPRPRALPAATPCR